MPLGYLDPGLFFLLAGTAAALAPASQALLKRRGPSPTNLHGVWGLLSFTFAEAIRAKWLLVFSAVFFLIALNIPVLLLSIAYNQSAVVLQANLQLGTSLSLAFPLIPLLGLPFGAVSIVDDRESGVMQYLMSYPISKSEFFLGRTAGLLLATTAVICLSFSGAAAAIYTTDSSQSVLILISMLVTVLLNAVMLALGLIISEVSTRKVTAMGTGIFAWFILTTLSDLPTLINATHLTVGNTAALLLVLLNPIETSRLVMVLATRLGPAQLGPTGFLASHVLGPDFFGVALASVLVWFFLLTTVGFAVFRRQDST